MSFEKVPNFLVNTFAADMTSNGTHSYRFNSFLLDVAERRLFHDDELVALTPKAFDVLVYLVEHSGHLVLKDELMQAVWPDSFVDEVNLPRTIHTIRAVLGEDDNGGKLIETVPTKGYRFLAKVDEVSEPGAVATGLLPPVAKNAAAFSGSDLHDDETVSPLAVNKAKPPARMILFTVGFASAVFLIFLLSFNFRSTPPVSPIKSIAVLPIKPLTVDSREPMYEFGIADSLILKLSTTKGLVVRPLSATRQYTGIEQDAVAAGREQKVDYVLASNYQIADSKVRVTAQIYNVSTGQVEETFRFEQERSDIFSIQDAFAADIGNRLMALFNVKQTVSSQNRGTGNEEAYRLYLQGMNLSDERGLENAAKALGYLENAVAIDPNYANAWAGIALLHRSLANNELEGHERYQKSMDAITKALAVDPNISDAYSALCSNKNRYEYDAAGAETACRRALELDPNSPQAHKTYSNFLYSRGRFDESIAEIRAAMEFQPVSYQNQQMYALALYYARRFEEAEGQFKRLIELNPNRGFTHGWLSEVLDAQGRHAEAFEHLIKKLTLEKAESATLDHFKSTYSASGWPGVTRERIKTPKAMIIPDSFQLASLYAKAGDNDMAFEYLEKAFQARSFWIAVLEVTPQMDPVRDDPRFSELVRRVGSK